MLGKDIKNYIEEKGVKQTFLAEKAELSPQAMNSILNGGRKVEAEEYFKICKALNVPLGFFFDEISIS